MSPQIVLDTSAVAAYSRGSVAVGELIMVAADEGETIGVPVTCVAEAHALAKGVEAAMLHHLASGGDTRDLARQMFVSEHTVQDHLKSVFAKTGVQTRGELVATLYVQQYEPRVDAGSTPSPYGWYLDDEIPAAG